MRLGALQIVQWILRGRIIVLQCFYFVNQLLNLCAASLATLRSTLYLWGTFIEAARSILRTI